MKRIVLTAILVTAPLLGACASADRTHRAEAWSRCRNAPSPEIRDRCIKTEVALIEAREQREADSRATARKSAEEREAQLQAHGVAAEDAVQTTDSGLELPD